MARVVTDLSARAHVDALLEAVANWLAGEVAEDARRFAPVDTGTLADSIVVEPGSKPGRMLVRALAAGQPPNEKAPAYVEYGTRPHVIRSRGRWPLRSHRTGQIFGPVVHHPGTPEQPYMRPAAYMERTIPPWVVKARQSWIPR